MQVRDLMHENGRVFFKSEYGPIGNRWPCVSFTKKSFGDKVRKAFKPGRDVLVYVGTKGIDTLDENHRGRLLSAVVVEPNQILKTEDVVSPQVWEQSVAKYGSGQWTFAMPVTKAAQFKARPLPLASDFAPSAYSSLGKSNRWTIAEAIDGERIAVMGCAVELMPLKLTTQVNDFIKLRAPLNSDVDPAVKQEACRLTSLIGERVKASGNTQTRTNPQRSAPDKAALNSLIINKWIEQQGRCALCGVDLRANVKNKMFQPSADRIDSSNGTYDENNLQITHLACNLAKNEYSAADFAEWLREIKRDP